jgi:hypothetical protein
MIFQKIDDIFSGHAFLTENISNPPLVSGIYKGFWLKKTRNFRYISSLPPNAETLAKAIRGHWGVENDCHWTCKRLI